MVDELRKAEIEPLLTLYHWDLPVWAEEEGGWKNPRIIEYYLEFVKAVVDALSDRVRYWMTFNEPSVFIVMAYVMGSFAPFKQDVDGSIYETEIDDIKQQLDRHWDILRMILKKMEQTSA